MTLLPILTPSSRITSSATIETLSPIITPLPPPNPGEIEECVFAHIRETDRATLEGCRKTGGYSAIEKVLADSPEYLVALITESKLAGRGGIN